MTCVAHRTMVPCRRKSARVSDTCEAAPLKTVTYLIHKSPLFIAEKIEKGKQIFYKDN